MSQIAESGYKSITLVSRREHFPNLTQKSGTCQRPSNTGPLGWLAGGERMTAREFLTNITIILAVMAVGALLETVVPMFAAKAWKQDRRTANLGLTALFVRAELAARIARGRSSARASPGGVDGAVRLAGMDQHRHRLERGGPRPLRHVNHCWTSEREKAREWSLK
jgi:hypothetical protein